MIPMLQSSLPRLLNRLLFNRTQSRDQRANWRRQISHEKIDGFDIATRMLLDTNGLKMSESRILTNHLYYIHKARLKMVHNLLPKAARILDLGGANSPLFHMFYRHKFDYMLMIDLPQDQRHELHKATSESSGQDGLGEIEILYCDMTNLRTLNNESFDLIWSGQSIEHINLEQGQKMLSEVRRLLRPGGSFCLDTPNRLITQIHTADIGGGFIHPEHQLEYKPAELQSLLTKAGFQIEEKKGICEMPETAKSGKFHYEDFLWGSEISDNIDASYIQYYRCK